MILLQLAILIFSLFNNNSNANVEVSISGIRSAKGQIIIGIYKNQSSFEKEKSYLVKKFEKKEIRNNQLVITFFLEPGIYGLTLLDDENNNAKMEYNFMGMPQEGFGFSNYYHSGFTRPKFESFKIEIKENVMNKGKIKIRYM
jgi:uncharacterized protein (DUF2141 family)